MARHSCSCRKKNMRAPSLPMSSPRAIRIPPPRKFKAPLGGDRLGGLEPRAGVRDEADPGKDLCSTERSGPGVMREIG
jgi:hypothetical protein